MAENILRDSSLIIENSSQQYESIKAYLTRVFKSYHDNSNYIAEFYSKDNSSNIRIPRYFPLEKFYKEFEVIDILNNGEDIGIETNIVLKNDLQIETSDYMLNNNKGIIKLDPGSGKTVISIYVISKRKKKSLILVHRNSLVDQWKERFLQFTNLKEEQITIFKTSSIEKSLNSPIVISTVQSLLSAIENNEKNNIKEVLKKSNFGICIADEIHTTLGAQNFSKCSLYIPSIVNFGLSATPLRKDGTDDILSYHLGNIYSPIGNSDTMEAIILVILFDFKIVRGGRRNKYFYFSGKFEKSRYLSQMKKSESFFNVSFSLLDKFKDRNIIFINERIEIIEILYHNIKEDNDKSKFIQNAGNEELEKRVTFATPGKIRDGIDIPKKDLLIMSSPISNINQLSGRVIRSYPNKKHPILVDLVDIGCKDIYSTYWNRFKFYSEKKWKIKYFEVTNNIVSEIEYDRIIELLK